ncbi:O-antigen ligase family protein [Chitinolyticbacter meiyuanensis]|uniref:O-antigen ligase family protein n=1 Tax=Chitinolyticbacter meiyuanensis TaxID=682798 RepID=UPI0011E5CEF9|nr:O-antigen ligase family protein [Chitinolyticbacter meiyuanensis]
MKLLDKVSARWGGWVLPLLVFALPFAHTVALRHVLSAAMLLLGGLYCWRHRPRDWPIALPFLAWSGWALLSATWSIYPRETLSAWWGTALASLLAFYTAYHLSAGRAARMRMFIALALSVVILLLMSLFGFRLLQPDLPIPAWLYHYPGVGLASTYAVLMLPLCGLATLSVGRRLQLAGWLGIAACLIVGAATLNRVFWLAAALTLAVLFLPRLNLRRAHGWLLGGVVLAGLLFALAGVNQSRLSLAQQGDVLESAMHSLQQMAERDPRPQVWRAWSSQVAHAPWIGLGYGQAVPGEFLRSARVTDPIINDRLTGVHAHNVLINTALQTGVVGLALLVWFFAALLRAFWRRRHEQQALAAAGMALVVALLAKSLTDDFIRDGLAIYFCLWAGFLLARAREPVRA